RGKGTRQQQVAVGAEGLVDLLELEQIGGIGMPPPVVEIAHEAARLAGLALRPTLVVRQAVEQRMARDGQELLALGRPPRLPTRRRPRPAPASLERAPVPAPPCRSCQRHVVPRRPLTLSPA